MQFMLIATEVDGRPEDPPRGTTAGGATNVILASEGCHWLTTIGELPSVVTNSDEESTLNPGSVMATSRRHRRAPAFLAQIFGKADAPASSAHALGPVMFPGCPTAIRMSCSCTQTSNVRIPRSRGRGVSPRSQGREASEGSELSRSRARV